MSEGKPEVDRKWVSLPARLFVLVTSPTGLGRFIRFALVGLSGVFVDMPIFWALYNYTSLPDLIAILPAYAVATVWNFMLNDAWTFRDRRERTKRSKAVRLGKYALVSVPPLAYRLGAYWPLKELSDLQYMLAYTVAIIVGMTWNFSVNFLWTWRKRSQQPKSDD